MGNLKEEKEEEEKGENLKEEKEKEKKRKKEEKEKKEKEKKEKEEKERKRRRKRKRRRRRRRTLSCCRRGGLRRSSKSGSSPRRIWLTPLGHLRPRISSHWRRRGCLQDAGEQNEGVGVRASVSVYACVSPAHVLSGRVVHLSARL